MHPLKVRENFFSILTVSRDIASALKNLHNPDPQRLTQCIILHIWVIPLKSVMLLKWVKLLTSLNGSRISYFKKTLFPGDSTKTTVHTIAICIRQLELDRIMLIPFCWSIIINNAGKRRKENNVYYLILAWDDVRNELSSCNNALKANG